MFQVALNYVFEYLYSVFVCLYSVFVFLYSVFLFLYSVFVFLYCVFVFLYSVFVYNTLSLYFYTLSLHFYNLSLYFHFLFINFVLRPPWQLCQLQVAALSLLPLDLVITLLIEKPHLLFFLQSINLYVNNKFPLMFLMTSLLGL